MNIGKIKEVELRELWKNEEHDFSNWLVKDENIEYLNEILGLTLVDVRREEHVGSFECDVFAKDESSDTNIIIENQLEKSNHDHLGKIITYASGLNANVIVWIVKKAREEHRSAIEWLNNNTNSNLNFFLIELHAIRIDNSVPAPMFDVVEKPNEFIKNNKAILSSNGDGPQNKSQRERLEFWTMFNEVLEDMGKPFPTRSASLNNWYDVSIGSSKSWIRIQLVNREHFVRVGMIIKEDDYDTFDKLYEKKDLIENEIGIKLEWLRESNGNASRIKYNIKGLNFDDHSNYTDLMKLIIDITCRMQNTFKKYI